MGAPSGTFGQLASTHASIWSSTTVASVAGGRLVAVRWPPSFQVRIPRSTSAPASSGTSMQMAMNPGLAPHQPLSSGPPQPAHAPQHSGRTARR